MKPGWVRMHCSMKTSHVSGEGLLNINLYSWSEQLHAAVKQRFTSGSRQVPGIKNRLTEDKMH